MNRSKGKVRRIHGYKSSDKILLVGEGDFSFSACLARAFHTAENIVATTYLKRKSLLKEHWTSISHLDELENFGCKLLYKVDVYKMDTQSALKNLKFDIIIYNFPHAGHYDYLCEHDRELIEMHMELVEAYFKSASKMLAQGGKVHLRHREDHPYDSWNVVLLAGKAGLTLKEKVDFNKSDYLGYHNKRGGGINTNKSFPIKCAYTYKFTLDLPKVVIYHHYDLHMNDEVHVLEMNNHVPNDHIEVLCGKNTVCDPVNVSKFQEEDHVISKLQKDAVGNLLEKDEANDDLFVPKTDEVHLLKNDRTGVDLSNSNIDLHVPEIVDDHLNNDEVHLLKNGRTGVDIPNSDIDLHVPKIVDVSEQCSKSDKVGDDLLKYDDQVSFDFELLKVTDHGDLLKNNKVNADLDLLKVDDCQMNIEIQKLDKKHLKSEDELGDDHDIPSKDEVYTLDMRHNPFQQHYKKDKVREDDQDLSKKDEALLMKDKEHKQQHFDTDKTIDHFVKSEERDSDLLKKDEVDNNLRNNEVFDDEVDVDDEEG